MLTPNKAIEQATILKRIGDTERGVLDTIRRYYKGLQRVPVVIPVGAPREVRVMEKTSRINVMPIVVDSLVQSTLVDGYRTDDSSVNADPWQAWQANRMDARQTEIHRAAFLYGTSYAVVLPGVPEPVIRGASPRSLTAAYGEDPDWPIWALERLGHGLWRLYDDEAIYYLESKHHEQWTFIEAREHRVGYTPVVRFRDKLDLDDDDEVLPEPGSSDMDYQRPTRGQLAALMSVQDQIDLTTFDLQLAQHYNGFRQRVIIGWTADSEAEQLKVAASQLLAIEDHPDEVKIAEWSQGDLSGFIDSREASMRHIAALSQTPVHELIGSLVNLSAEALAAAEAGKDRKVGESQNVLGESHEQLFALIAMVRGDAPASYDAQVKWRDTSARAFAATVDGLGKLVQMLGIPPQELWDRVPGVTQQDVESWKTAAASGDSFAMLTQMLDRQATDPTPPV